MPLHRLFLLELFNSTTDLFNLSMSLKARDYSTPVTGNLTDESIFQYCLDGVYGEEKRRWAEEQLRRVKRLKRKAQPSRRAAVKMLLHDLGI